MGYIVKTAICPARRHDGLGPFQNVVGLPPFCVQFREWLVREVEVLGIVHCDLVISPHGQP